MVFVSRESAEMVAKERALKRQGVVDTGVLGVALQGQHVGVAVDDASAR